MANVPEIFTTARTTNGSASKATLAVIGITDHAQEQLGDVVYVELPKAGRSICRPTNHSVQSNRSKPSRKSSRRSRAKLLK